MSQHDPEAFLLDMAHYANVAQEYVAGQSLAALRSDPMRTHAILYALQTIGEAARRLGREYHSAHPEIPWPDIIALRNRLVHDYDKIDLQLLLEVVDEDLPRLLAFIQQRVPPPTLHDDPQ